MVRWSMAGVLAACVTVVGSLATQAGAGPQWVTDYARARQEARASGKPIFLVFRCER